MRGNLVAIAFKKSKKSGKIVSKLGEILGRSGKEILDFETELGNCKKLQEESFNSSGITKEILIQCLLFFISNYSFA